MKALYQILVLGTMALLISIGVGCGEKSKKSSSPGVVTPQACGVGQIFSPAHNACLQQCAQAGYGVDPNTNQCVHIEGGIPNNDYGSFGHIWTGRMVITNSGLYRDFLEEYGRVCNPIVIGWNWGSANCKSWDSYGYLYIEAQGNKPPVYGAATIVAYSDYSYYYGGVPISVTGNFQPINNNSGFELRTTGMGFTPSYNDVISVIAEDNGSLNSDGTFASRIRVRLKYKGGEFGYSEVSQ
ncbi:MAG: hypothetical protein H6624_19240 [Bdellovibrionaceae bacterium]|nr:hypothetical protein [Bdellovibrionales bacterium]MCB9086484.1 hypothetical protein [Pseudobdellovibrionaceae bacterium]